MQLFHPSLCQLYVIVFAFQDLYFNLGNGDDGLGGGGLLGLLGIGQLELSGDAVEVTTALACQSPATVGVLLCQLQILKCLELNIKVCLLLPHDLWSNT